MKRYLQFSTGQLAIQLLRDPDRKSIARMVVELLYLSVIFKKLPIHYFSRLLFKKDRTNIRDYFPGKVLYGIKPHFNEKSVVDVLENKLSFDFFYSQFNISLPKILMYNYRNVFVVNKTSYTINSASEFRLLLKEEIFRNNKITDSIFVKRTYGTYGGDKVYKLYLNQLESDNQLVIDLFKEVIQTGYLFQETIRQHQELNRLNPSCINTIRLDTFLNRDGKVEIISGYLRTSFNNHHVDNISSGGCAVGIDPATGKLEDVGYMNLKDGGVRQPAEHPITHTVFHDFTIPYFEQARQLVIQVAGYVPNMRMVGWDVAIGESGPVLVEGNSDYDLAGTDTFCNGARSNPVFRKILREINYI
jgi:hypothetical protein